MLIVGAIASKAVAMVLGIAATSAVVSTITGDNSHQIFNTLLNAAGVLIASVIFQYVRLLKGKAEAGDPKAEKERDQILKLVSDVAASHADLKQVVGEMKDELVKSGAMRKAPRSETTKAKKGVQDAT